MSGRCHCMSVTFCDIIVSKGSDNMKLIVKAQALELENIGCIAEGSLNYLTFELQCDSVWDGYVRTVRFCHGEVVCDLPEVEDGVRYYVPSAVLTAGEVCVSVIGVKDGVSVLTTAQAPFTVKASVGGGKTPEVTVDAYAKYVQEVISNRKTCEELSKETARLRQSCEEMLQKARTEARFAADARKRCESVMREVSGMMDAVCMAMKEVYDVEKRLTHANSVMCLSEERRIRNEKARRFTEDKRVLSERERRENELSRQASESKRIGAEDVRRLLDGERSKRLALVEEMLSKAEALTSPLTVTHTVMGDGVVYTDNSPDVIRVYGRTTVSDGAIKGLGNNGGVALVLNGRSVTVPLSAPLYSAGETADVLRIHSDGGVFVERRTAVYTLDRVDDVYGDDGGEERILYAIPLKEASLCDKVEGECNLFAYGTEETGNSVWIDGDYLFLYLDKDEYPNSAVVKEWLSSRVSLGCPLSIVYAVREKQEQEGSIDPIALGNAKIECHDARISVEYKRDINNVISELEAKIDKITESPLYTAGSQKKDKGENNENT